MTMPRLIAVASGKGGVGKTWLAITLAQALAQSGAQTGRRVLLVDGDMGLANIDIQLGLGDIADIGQVTCGAKTLAQIIHPFPSGGFAVAAGRSGTGTLASLPHAAITALIAQIRCQNFSDIILDLGAGLDRATRTLASAADTLLVLATDEPTSLTDAYAVLKIANQDNPGQDMQIVINQASTPATGARTYAALTRATHAFLHLTPKLAGIVRADAHVRDAIRRQSPLLTRHPTSAAAQDVQAIARILSAAPPQEHTATPTK